jgi:MinD superfamily P-loop ATPase
MKQLVILSGKGGTGKTSLTAAFAHLAKHGIPPTNAILADADVDAANLELVLAPQIIEREDFWGGQLAVIDPDLCSGCGTCIEVCRFDALGTIDQPGFRRLALQDPNHPQSLDVPVLDPIACDGCAACVYQCPEEAITMQEQIAGEWFRSESRYGPLLHAALIPAQENSGKLVTLVKQHARLMAMDQGVELVLVDGPPGIGCPVISAASGADLALIVAEPTAAGVHDMRRVMLTTDHFGVDTLVCVNKADLYLAGTDEIKAYCQQTGIEFVGEIPFDLSVTEAMVQGQPVTAYRPESPASQALSKIWSKVRDTLLGNNV